MPRRVEWYKNFYRRIGKFSGDISLLDPLNFWSYAKNKILGVQKKYYTSQILWINFLMLLSFKFLWSEPLNK
jgi:hypothetical protein